jgi:pseudaminic acid synthase
VEPIPRQRLADLWASPALVRPPYIVAELSGNHNGCLERAHALVAEAAACGVDAIKLQTYTADTITLDAPSIDFHVCKPGSAWDGRSLYSLYAEASLPWEWHRPLVEQALSLGLEWFSSPFDFTAIDFLETLDVPCYKIASPELVDLPLIARAARTGKPLIMSTGMASLEEIGEAVTAARAAGATYVMLLKCTTDYPASPKDSNLSTIADLAVRFECPVGVSDHTLGIGASIAAAVLGATLIEKHLTLCRADGGPDAHFSLEPSEMAALVRECRAAHDSLGAVAYGPRESERGYTRGRRSLYICADLSKGDRLTPHNLRSIRPGFGLPPKHYEAVLGRTVKRDIPRGTPLAWADLVG